MSLSDIKNSIRNIPNHPKPGIQFKDITTAMKQPNVMREIIDMLAAHFAEAKIDYVVGIEARGFIFGAALAYKLGCGFVPVRKPGKLPAKTIAEEYALEYGTDKLEIHQDALQKGDRVLIVDDLIAIGGTAEAAAKLVQKLGAEIVAFAFVIELLELDGRAKLEPVAEVYSLVQY
ncbi:MAG: adenine phosphoribosyltransferase [Alphaproteobacteria bacterium]|jgi:adenine phosphoribosyltransferase|nr:adenine phosphoribosyltransferase [Alphaproteobacteria bacterium]